MDKDKLELNLTLFNLFEKTEQYSYTEYYAEKLYEYNPKKHKYDYLSALMKNGQDKEAYELLIEGAKYGDIASCLLLGEMHFEGRYVDQSYEKAIEWYEKCEGKIHYGHYYKKYSVCYLKTNDENNMVRILELGAKDEENDNQMVCYKLLGAYYNDVYDHSNMDWAVKAHNNYAKAAELGDDKSDYECYLIEVDVFKMKEETQLFRLFRAAKRNDYRAIDNLAIYCFKHNEHDIGEDLLYYNALNDYDISIARLVCITYQKENAEEHNFSISLLNHYLNDLDNKEEFGKDIIKRFYERTKEDLEYWKKVDISFDNDSQIDFDPIKIDQDDDE